MGNAQVAEALYRAYLERATGWLTCTSQGRETKIPFRDGSVVSSALGTGFGWQGKVPALVQQGRLGLEQLDALWARGEASAADDDTLDELGVLPAEADAARVLASIRETVRAAEGVRFEPGEVGAGELVSGAKVVREAWSLLAAAAGEPAYYRASSLEEASRWEPSDEDRAWLARFEDWRQPEGATVQQLALLEVLTRSGVLDSIPAEEMRRREEAERSRLEEEARQRAEQARLEAEERARLEEEERQKAEQARLEAEERARLEEEERQKAEQARLEAEERARLEEEERQKAEQARLEAEERARLEEEERQKAEQARLEAEERARLEEEERQKAEQARLEEEERKKAEQARLEAEERARLEEEERKKAEQARLEAEESARLEEEERQRAEQARLEAEESARLEEEERQRAEQARLEAEERARLEEEERQRAEQARLEAEERARLEEEERQRAEQARLEAEERARLEEEERQRAEQARLEAEERARLEEEERQRAEQARLEAEERARLEEEERQRAEQARLEAEERARLEEEERQRAEQERLEVEQRARLEEAERQRVEQEGLEAEQRARLEEEARQVAEQERLDAEERAAAESAEVEALLRKAASAQARIEEERVQRAAEATRERDASEALRRAAEAAEAAEEEERTARAMQLKALEAERGELERQSAEKAQAEAGTRALAEEDERARAEEAERAHLAEAAAEQARLEAQRQAEEDAAEEAALLAAAKAARERLQPPPSAPAPAAEQQSLLERMNAALRQATYVGAAPVRKEEKTDPHFVAPPHLRQPEPGSSALRQPLKLGGQEQDEADLWSLARPGAQTPPPQGVQSFEEALRRVDSSLEALVGHASTPTPLPEPIIEAEVISPPPGSSLGSRIDDLEANVNDDSAEEARQRRQRLLRKAMENLGGLPPRPPESSSSAITSTPSGVTPAPSTPSIPPPSAAEQTLAMQIDARYAQLKTRDHFITLGVTPEATRDQIKAAFLGLAKTFHPDRLPPSLPHMAQKMSAVFESIREAYDTLYDDQKRAAWVAGQKSTQKPPAAQQASDLFKMAEVFFKKRDYKQAEQHFAKAHALDKGANSLAAQAWSIYMDPSRKAEAAHARQLMENALTIDARSDRAHYQLGVIARVEGDIATAERHFREAVKANPKHLEANQEIRLIEMRRKKAEPKKGGGFFS